MITASTDNMDNSSSGSLELPVSYGLHNTTLGFSPVGGVEQSIEACKQYFNTNFKIYETSQIGDAENLIRELSGRETGGYDVNEEVGKALKVLWGDPGVQYCFQRRNEFHLLESCRQ
jgi:hypothetical protein